MTIPSSAPAADVSPQMAEAMKTFPQWTQEQIQGYFDQVDIPSLLEWVNSQSDADDPWLVHGFVGGP